MNNVNDLYFDGYYKEIWKTLIPEELTRKETEFMVPHFALQPGSRVLDLMCGYGRHALALAKQGIQVTAIDNLPAYTDEIRQKAAEENLPVETVCTGVLSFQPAGLYDLAICMGNSLNFFNADDTARILSNTAGALKPGGHLLINSWTLAEIVYARPLSNNWSRIGGYTFLNAPQFRQSPTRVEVESIILGPDGDRETKTGVDYIYSLNEMEQLLHGAGFRLEATYSIPGRKTFSPGDPRAYLVARKAD